MPFARVPKTPRDKGRSNMASHHRSYWLMRQTKTLPLPSVSLYSESLQVVVSPCWKLALPDFTSAILA
jgi:hypothetical protein